MGIHRSMRLHWFAAPVLTDIVPKVRVRSLDSRAFSVDITCAINNPQSNHTRTNSHTRTDTAICVEVSDGGSRVASARMPVSLVEGLSEHRVIVNVSGVKLWWPNEMGAQHMYDLVVTLCGNNVHDGLHDNNNDRDGHHHHRDNTDPASLRNDNGACVSGAFTERMCKRIGFREVRFYSLSIYVLYTYTDTRMHVHDPWFAHGIMYTYI